MRKLSIACIALGALVAGPAMAADLGLPALKAPPPLAPAYSWTGCYLGVQGGGGFMHDSFVDNSDDPIFHGGGAIAGGQAGCNYQIQNIVLGIEGEGWWSGLSNKDTNNSTTTLPLELIFLRRRRILSINRGTGGMPFLRCAAVMPSIESCSTARPVLFGAGSDFRRPPPSKYSLTAPSEDPLAHQRRGAKP